MVTGWAQREVRCACTASRLAPTSHARVCTLCKQGCGTSTLRDLRAFGANAVASCISLRRAIAACGDATDIDAEASALSAALPQPVKLRPMLPASWTVLVKRNMPRKTCGFASHGT